MSDEEKPIEGTTKTADATDAPAAQFQKKLDELKGDGVALARTLFDDNFRTRQRAREAEAKLPKEGSVVLSGDDAAAWQELGTQGGWKAVKAALASGTEATTEVAKFKRSKLLSEAATIAGYDPEVLESLAGDKLEITFKPDPRAPKSRKLAFVKDGEKETALTEYAETSWAKFLPSLKAISGQPARPNGTPPHRDNPAPIGGNADRQSVSSTYEKMLNSGSLNF